MVGRMIAKPSAQQLVDAGWLPLRSVSSGVWETTIQLSGDQGTSERMVAMMWLFGFGLYL
jgi:hypothetical protein